MHFRVEYMSVDGHRTGDGFYIEDFISASWITRFNDHGEAQLELPYRYAPLILDMYRYPVTPYLLFSESDETMFMTKAQIKQNDKGEPVVLLFFTTLDKFLAFRRITSSDYPNAPAERKTFIERCIRKEFIDRSYTPQLSFVYSRFGSTSSEYFLRSHNGLTMPLTDAVYGQDVTLQLGDSTVWDAVSYYGLKNNLRVTMRLNDPDIDDRGWAVHIEDFSDMRYGNDPPLDITPYISFSEALIDPKDFYNAYEYIYPYVERRDKDPNGFYIYWCSGELMNDMRGGDRSQQMRRWVAHGDREEYLYQGQPVHRYPIWARVESTASFLDFYNLTANTAYQYKQGNDNSAYTNAVTCYNQSISTYNRKPPSDTGGVAAFTCKIEDTDEFVLGRDYAVGERVAWTAFNNDMVARREDADLPMLMSRVLEHSWTLDSSGIQQTTVIGSAQTTFSTTFGTGDYH